MQGIDILGVVHSIEKYSPKDTGTNRFNMGMWLEDQCKILISDTVSDYQVPATIYHEVLHAVLKAVGESELSENEDFVEKLSRALMQVSKLNIKKYSVLTNQMEVA